MLFRILFSITIYSHIQKMVSYLLTSASTLVFPFPFHPSVHACDVKSTLADDARGTESIAVMGPEATSEYFNISGSIQSTNSSLFLNIGSDSTSYKTLTLGTTATMSAWALEGDTIITAQTSSYGRRE